MRLNAFTRTLVSVGTAAGLTAAMLVTGSPSFAASAPSANSTVSAKAPITTLAVVNLGLSAAQAKNVQRWLQRHWGYTDGIDGSLGPNSWKAFQRCLKTYWGYDGAIDGSVGPKTVMALQRLLKDSWGYTGDIDGDPGPLTQAAFKRFADRAA